MKFQVLLYVLLFSPVFAAESLPTNLSKFEGKVVVNKTSNAFEFIISIPEDIKYNFKAPWKLTIDGDIKLKPSKNVKLGKKDFKKNKFTVPFTALGKGTSNYKIKYALCDISGDKCKFFKDKGEIKL